MGEGLRISQSWRLARRAIEKLAAPGSIISYAQAGEDLVLDFLTGHRPSGFYVDVGCNHPVRASNSYRFYRKGWHGIAVDANRSFARDFARMRPRDRFFHACVSDWPGEVDFHLFRDPALSSISGKPLFQSAEQYQLERVERLPTRRLSSILEESGAPARFDFLSIDVEGHDEEVLRSVDLARHSPAVIVIELNAADLDVAAIADSSVARHLAGFGYAPIAAHWSNV